MHNTVFFHSALETAEAKFREIENIIAMENETFIEKHLKLKAKKRKVKRYRFLKYLLLGELYEQKLYDVSQEIHELAEEYTFTIQELSERLSYAGRFIARIKRAKKKHQDYVHISDTDSEFFNFDISHYLYNDAIFRGNRVD